MIKKKLLLLIIVLITFSCSNDVYYKKEMTNMTLDKKQHCLQKFRSIYVFVPVNEDSIGMTKLFNMEFIYSNYFSHNYSNFSSFLYQSFNQNVKFNSTYFERSGFVFRLNNKLFKECKSLGVKFTLDKYSTIIGERYCINKIGENEDKLYAILYYLFLNKYTITSDDYIGMYYVKMLNENK